jgi:OOP family OmpA-OmpF porin
MKNIMKFTKTSLVLGLAAGLCGTAVAQPIDGWYAGGNVGRSAATIDDDGIRSGLLGQGLATSSIEDRDRDTGYKVFGGYKFHRNFAVEAGFFNLGTFGYTATTVPPGSLTGDVRIRGLNLDLVGILPVTDRLSVLGRVGVVSARSKGHFSSTGAVTMPFANPDPSERSTGAKVGIGMQYDFTDRLALRGEVERYRVKDSISNKGHIDLLSVGLIYRFGAATPVRTTYVAPAPVYVAPPPAPAPVYVAPPPPAPAPVVMTPPPPAPAPVMAPDRPAKPYRN